MIKRWRRVFWTATVGLCLAAVGLIAVGSAPTLAVTTTSVGPWSQSNADAALSRSNAAESVLTASTVANAHYLRSLVAEPPQTINENNCTAGRFPAPPVIFGGAVYAMAGSWLTKTNASTGAVAWRVRQSSQDLYPDLAVSASGLVVLGNTNCISQSDPAGGLHAFQASTGAPAWSVPELPSMTAFDHFVLSQGYVVAIGETTAVSDNVDVAVYKVSTGAKVWSTTTPATCSPFGLRVLVAAGQVVYPSCTSTGSALVANNLTTGARTWSRPGVWHLGGANSDKPTAGHHLYAIDSAGNVEDLIPQTGATRFTLAGATAYLAVDGRRVYANCGSGGANLCAYDQPTGVRLWGRTGRSTPLDASAGGALYLADGSVLNTATGATITTLWEGTATALAVGNAHVMVVVDPRILDLYGLNGY